MQTGLSAADHGILSRLIEAGTPVVRQRDLCESMRWDRTRLSHHLKRMESRGLVQRSQKCDGTYLSATEEGRVACGAATPVHAAAVTKYFLKALTGSQKEMLAELSHVLRGEQAAGKAL